MTFKEWQEENDRKKEAILEKIGDDIDTIVEYFQYDNMKVKEPDYCPLYRANQKCHNMKDLNCFFCGCPYFFSSDKPLNPPDTNSDIKIMSKCAIDSKDSSVFVYNDIQQCDCSNCFLPHRKGFVRNYLKRLDEKYNISDSYSLLELIRNYQLNDVLGKLKIF